MNQRMARVNARMVKIRYEPKNGKRKCKDGEDQVRSREWQEKCKDGKDQVRSRECQEEIKGW